LSEKKLVILGKTVGICNMLRNLSEYFIEPPQQIIWFYSHFQPLMQPFADSVVFVDGWDIERLKGPGNKLAIVDDLMETIPSDQLTTLFVRGGHHWNASIFFICQVNVLVKINLLFTEFILQKSTFFENERAPNDSL
jgi:hypothetical protein